MCLLNGTCGGTFLSAVTVNRLAGIYTTIVSAERHNSLDPEIDVVCEATIVVSDDISLILAGEEVTLSGILKDPSFNGTWKASRNSNGRNIYLDMYTAIEVLTPIIPGAETPEEEDQTWILTTTDQDVSIYQTIQELVSHFGNEPLHKIIINDIDNNIRELIKWQGENPLYVIRVGESSQYELVSSYPGDGYPSIAKGEIAGYQYTTFVYPEELVADAGQSICDVLDKIKNTLGNYEYFYDVNGNFVFQEIKNYYNTSYSTILINEMTNENYVGETKIRSKTLYDFNDGKLITSISNTPAYGSIKNDFMVWGNRTSATDEKMPIRYHLVFDEKPTPTQSYNEVLEDWRNVLYREGLAAAQYGTDSNAYYVELANEWPLMYNSETLEWNEDYVNDPSSLSYFLDFIDTDSSINELNVNNIGRRTKVVVDDTINCIFAPEVPSYIILVEYGEGDNPTPLEVAEAAEKFQLAIDQKANYILVSPTFLQGFSRAAGYNDAFSLVRNMLYESVSYNNIINLSTVPIYYLDVNTRISVYDAITNINGDFMISSISLPLGIPETMSINASAVLQRI